MSIRQTVTLGEPLGDMPPVLGVRVGGYLFSSTIPGADLRRGVLGDGPERQFALAFRNLAELVEKAGLGLDRVAHVTVFIADASYRPYINDPWLDLFPNPPSRPARKTTHTPLPEGSLVQLQVLGVAEGGREPLEIPGLAHRDPLPMGCKIGSLVFSSVLGGDDPGRGQARLTPGGGTPSDPALLAAGAARPEGEAQIRQAFANMRTLVERAGGTTDDILLVWVYLGDFSYQSALVDTWLEMFPDEGDRPARKTIQYDLGGRTTLIQLQMVAVLGGRRENFEIPGIGHHDPIPLAARKGNLLCSSGIGATDPATGRLAQGAEAQTQQAFLNLGTLMERAGASFANVAHVTAMVGDLASSSAILDVYRSLFPVEGDRPALNILNLGVAGRDTLVQIHAIAAFP